MPVPPVTNLGLSSSSDVITFDQNHIYFCRRKRSSQWCPDQSDRPNGALDMQKKAQKVEWKTQIKISCHFSWLLHAKTCPSRWRFLRSFLTASKPSRRSLQQKEEKRRKRNGEKKKFQKSKSLKTSITFSSKISKPILISAHARVTMH